MSKYIDKSIDDVNCKRELKKIVNHIFKTSEIQVSKGKENIKYDFKLHNCFGTNTMLNCELKTRYSNFDDIAVEITQYQNVSDVYRNMRTSRKSSEEIVDYLENVRFGSGWMFHTEAKVIIYVTYDHVDIINWYKLKEYMIQNFSKLQDKYSGKTTGSFNKLVRINRDTMGFIKRYKDEVLQGYLDGYYKELSR